MSADPRPIPDKHAFKIGEASRLVGVKPHVLRFWEKEFAQVRPRKASNGHRLYARSDVELLRRIRELLHDRGFTIEGARNLLREGDEAVAAALEPSPSVAAAELDEIQGLVERLRGELEAARSENEEARRALRRAREEAEFWRVEAHRAEARAGRLHQVLRDEVAALEALAES